MKKALLLSMLLANLFCSYAQTPFVIYNSSGGNLNIRATPSTSGTFLCTIGANKRLVTTGNTSSSWYEVYIPINGIGSPTLAWVSSGTGYMLPDNNAAQVEVTGTNVLIRKTAGGTGYSGTLWAYYPGYAYEYASTAVNQRYYPTGNTQNVNGTTWYEVDMPRSCYQCNNGTCASSSDFTITTLGWISGQYLNYISPCSSPTNISFSGTQSACSGSTTSISVSASNCSGCSYQWSNGGNGSSQSLSPGNYTVTATNNCGSSASNSISISSLLQPNTPSLNTPTTVCQGQSASISVTNSASCANCNYSWSNGGSGTSTSVSSGGIYTVTATNSCGTATATTSNIATGQLPTQPTISGSLTFCTGSNTTLTVSNPCAGCTYNWSNGQNNTQSIQVSTANTYTVTATNTCGSASNSVTVTQTAAQPIPTINGNLSFCMGSSTSLSIGNACTGCTYLWSNNSTQQSINVNSAASYSVTVTGACGTASSSVNVTQSSLTANAGNDVNIQSGGSTTLNGSGGISCAWSPSIGLNSSTTCNPTASPTTTTTYTLTVTDANGCTATDAVEVSVGATLHADFYASQTSGYAPLTVNFFSSSTGGPTSYAWDFYGNGVSPAQSTSASPIVTYDQCGSFTVKLSIFNGGNTDDEVKTGYINVICTGIDDKLVENGIEIFPNPSNGKFEISVLRNQNYVLKILNAMGQVVSEDKFSIGKHVIDLGSSAKGIYMLYIESNKQTFSKKIIVE